MSTTVVDDEFRQRLRLIMQQFGSIADLALAVGVSDNAVYKWISGRGQPSMVSLVNLAKAAGVSVEWLATGRGPVANAKADVHSASEASEFIQMPRHGIRNSSLRLGIQSSQIVDHLSFRADWLQHRLGTDPRSLALVEAIGDSMSPTVDDGDVVLVDLRETRFKDDGIYVLRAGNDLSIKRIQRQPDGSLTIRSDNAAYERLTVSPDMIALFGRVIWVGGRL
jgi:phage repressor protein C with HTH and peptisase S24 domain